MLLVVMVNYTISEERQFCRCLGASEAVAKATSASLPTCHGVVLHNQKPHSHKTTFPINHRHYCHLFLEKGGKNKDNQIHVFEPQQCKTFKANSLI